MRQAKPLATWLAFADKLPQIGLSICSEAPIPETEKGARHPKVIAGALLLRTVSNFKGAIALTRARRVVEARVLTRCCFENIFYMSELTARGDAFVGEMHNDESRSRKALGELILSEGLTLDAALKQRIRAQLREINRRAPEAKFLSITGVARGGLLADSEYLYRQLSRDAAHPTFTSLNRYVRRFEKNGQIVRGLDADPVVHEVELSQTANWACVAMILACAAVNEILGGTLAAEQLLKTTDEWRALDHG